MSEYPKWVEAPPGWTHKNRPYREWEILGDGKMRVVVLDEIDERDLKDGK